MKAPEKIYLQQQEEEEFHNLTTWSEDEINEADVVYIRADLVKDLINNESKETFKKIANDMNLVDWQKGSEG